MRIPGVGLGDTVPVTPNNMAAPGELIANRHTERRIDRMLSPYGTSMGAEIAGEQRPHSAGMTYHATGGVVKNPHTGIIGVPGVLAYRAMAAMAAGVNQNIANGIGGGGAGGVGPLGPAGGPAGTGTFEGVAVAKWIIPELRYARRHGWTGQVSNGWRDPRRVIVPSPRRPVAPQGQSEHGKTRYPHGAFDISGSDAVALAQEAAFLNITAGYHGRKVRPLGGSMATAGRDPGHMSGTGHAYGGRIGWNGWHAKGGSFEVNKPTLFGAGEAGPETVTISKGKGGKGIHVEIHNIQWNREGDVKKAIEREMELLAHDLKVGG